jgi:hypothetical protein
VIFAAAFSPSKTTFLTVGESAEGEERAVWAHPHPGGFLEGWGGGCEN